MRAKLLVLALLAGGMLMAAPRVFVGVGLGYAAPPVAVYGAPPAALPAYVPPSPGYGYSWVGGYWYPAGAAWRWRAGYWARPPYAHAYWVGPRYYGHRFYGGYWRRWR